MTPTFRHNTLHCRACGSEIDSATDMITGMEPYDGAVSICVICGEVSIFVIGPFGTALREPTMEEIADITQDETFQELRAALSQAQAEDPKTWRRFADDSRTGDPAAKESGPR